MTFLVFMLGGVLAAAVAGTAIWLKQAAAAELNNPAGSFRRVGGYPIVSDVRALGPNSDLGRARATVRGIVPGGLRLFWTREDARLPEGAELQLYFELLFQSDLGFLPAGWSVRLSDSELSIFGPVTKTHPDPRAQAHAAGSRIIKQLQTPLSDRLQQVVQHRRPGLAAVALRELLRLYPDDPETERLAQDALQSPDVELRLAAAGVDYLGSRTFVLEQAREWGGGQRSEAILLVAQLGSAEDLKSVGVHPVPEDVAPSYLESLIERVGPEAEDILLHYLDTPQVERVADALIALGTRKAVRPLRHRARQKTTSGEALAIELALESISDRLEKSGRGVGDVSLAPHTGGDVSEVDGLSPTLGRPPSAAG